MENLFSFASQPFSILQIILFIGLLSFFCHTVYARGIDLKLTPCHATFLQPLHHAL